METRKIIRFLIAIFAFLTLFFTYFYLKEYNSKNVLSEQFVDSAVENLKNRGMEVQKNNLDRSVPEMDIYVFSRLDEAEYYEKITQCIVDNIFDGKAMKTGFDVPDGAAFGLYDQAENETELGRIVFSNSDMSFVFTKKSVNVSGGNELVFTGDVSNIPDKSKKTVENISDSLTSRQDMSYRICGYSGDSEMSLISVCQTVDGYDINNAYINFVFMNDELVKIVGNCISEKVSKEYHEILLDGINALFDTSLENAAEILSQRIVYTARKSEQGRYFLLPGWEIEYSDADDIKYRQFVDAI